MKRREQSMAWLGLGALCMASLAGAAEPPPPPEACVRALLLDGDGAPVRGAMVSFGWEGDESGGVPADSNGVARSSGLLFQQAVPLFVRGEGLYDQKSLLPFSELLPAKDSEPARWQPWDAMYTVVVKRVKHPIPMYAKSVDLDYPGAGIPVAFDLEQGDWVAPHGAGYRSDFIFQLDIQGHTATNLRAQLTLYFKNPHDGLVTVPSAGWNSGLASDYLAPEEGYQAEWSRRYGRGYDRLELEAQKNHNAYFRVRTETDKDGRMIKAWYGKLYGTFEMASLLKDRPRVQFIYYVNPSGDRNVEFDPDRNLIRQATLLERSLRP